MLKWFSWKWTPYEAIERDSNGRLNMLDSFTAPCAIQYSVHSGISYTQDAQWQLPLIDTGFSYFGVKKIC